VPGIVGSAASVTQLLVVPVMGGEWWGVLSRFPRVLLGFFYVLLFFFYSEDADLQFPAGHLAKARSQMWHS